MLVCEWSGCCRWMGELSLAGRSLVRVVPILRSLDGETGSQLLLHCG